MSSANSIRTVFKHHHSVFAKNHHFQITATGCRYNCQLEGPLPKVNAAVRFLSSWWGEKHVQNHQIHQCSYGHWMGETSLERCWLKHYHEVLSEDWFVSTRWTNRGRPLDPFEGEELANLKTTVFIQLSLQLHADLSVYTSIKSFPLPVFRQCMMG